MVSRKEGLKNQETIDEIKGKIYALRKLSYYK